MVTRTLILVSPILDSAVQFQSVAVHRSFRIDSFARVGELMVGVNFSFGSYPRNETPFAGPIGPVPSEWHVDKEPARIPFALFRGRELASGHRAERLGLAHDVPVPML